jgi:hypothetical protein
LQTPDHGTQHFSDLVGSREQFDHTGFGYQAYTFRQDQMRFQFLQRTLCHTKKLNERPGIFSTMSFGDVCRD